MKKIKILILSLTILFSLTTKATAVSEENYSNSSNNEISSLQNNDQISDPLEQLNRGIFTFNRFFDKLIIRPIAKFYDLIIPAFFQKRIGNFFSNIGEIPNIANDILQANGAMMLSDTWRFVTNSTVGIGGLFDVASKLGLEKNENDLSLTFMKWGIKRSPYLVLPFFGPSTIRDAIATFGNYAFLTVWPHINPETDRYLLLGIDYIDLRSDLLPGDKLIDEAFDPYIFVRDAYLQHQKHLFNQLNRAMSPDELDSDQTNNQKDQESVPIVGKTSKV